VEEVEEERKEMQGKGQGGKEKKPTKAIFNITRALPLRMTISLRTMGIRIMPIPNILEEMKLIFLREEGGTDTVDWGVSPTLLNSRCVVLVLDHDKLDGRERKREMRRTIRTS
jgi:hypothetical protein